MSTEEFPFEKDAFPEREIGANTTTRQVSAGSVTVFGAGIAGMTAAHELAERGFRVIIVEPEAEGTGTLQVGGMARTQAVIGDPDRFRRPAILPWTMSQNGRSATAPEEAHSRRAQSVLFRRNTDDFDDPSAALGVAVEMARELVKALSRQAEHGTDALNAYLRVTGFQAPCEKQATRDRSLRQDRITRSAKRLVSVGERRQGDTPTPGSVESKDKDPSLPERRATTVARSLMALVKDRLDGEVNRLTEEYPNPSSPQALRIDALRKRVRRLSPPPPEHAESSEAEPSPLESDVSEKPLIFLSVKDGWDPGDARVLIELAWEGEVELPGEHGYRFFPSFYRHLFDTMKRTPLYEGGRETHRVALDNLTPTMSQLFTVGLTSATLSRQRPRSLEAWRNELTRLLREMHFDVRDIVKFQAKVFRFMTTSSERRAAEYENLSWWQFLTHGGVGYGDSFEKFLKSAPQALVAMDAETCDARTQGNIIIQLLMDQLLPSEYTDCTLNGTTTGAWLDRWREHLRHLGVTFVTGSLKGFILKQEASELFGESGPITPTVELRLPSRLGPGETPDEACSITQTRWTKEIAASDYFVIATDVATAEQVTNDLAKGSPQQALPGMPRRSGGVPAHLREYVTYILSKTDMRIKIGGDDEWSRLLRERLAVAGFPPEYWGHVRNRDELPAWLSHAEEQDLRTGRPRPRAGDQYVYGLTKHDRFQTFSGVQFYFAHDLELARGHVYYVDSEWGLSSISPLQFWEQKNHLRRKGLLGVLSVDIGNFRNNSNYLNKPAHECTREEIAHEVWRQISESLRRARRANAEETQRLPLPRPIYYHVDDCLQPRRPTEAGTFCTTSTPFLVNNVGDWINRPGSDPWDPERNGIPVDLVDEPNVWQADHGGYQVHYHKIVFAGTYMRTFTRMTTMESANESARHAVNAILDHLAAVRTVAQRQAADFYSRWVRAEMDKLKNLGGTDDHRLDQVLKNKIQLPVPMHTIAGEHCKIWNLERLELDDLAFLKRVDEALFKKNLPHMADIIDLDSLAASLNPEHSEFSGLLSSLLSTAKADWAVDDDAASRGAKGVTAVMSKLKEGLTKLSQELGRAGPAS